MRSRCARRSPAPAPRAVRARPGMTQCRARSQAAIEAADRVRAVIHVVGDAHRCTPASFSASPARGRAKKPSLVDRMPCGRLIQAAFQVGKPTSAAGESRRTAEGHGGIVDVHQIDVAGKEDRMGHRERWVRCAGAANYS